MTTIVTTPNVPVVNAGVLYLSNMQLSYQSSTLLTVMPGAARDSKDINDIILNSQITIDITKQGANGIDSGVVSPATIYAVYIVGDSTKYKQTCAVISSNLVSPTLPFGYDMFRRIGWVCTDLQLDPVVVFKFYQYGSDETRSYYYDIDDNNLNYIIQSGTSTTYSEAALSPIIPPIETQVFCRVLYTQGLAVNSAQFLPFGASNARGIVSISSGIVTTYFQTVQIPCSIDGTASAIKYKVSAGDSINLYVYGYNDYL